MKPLFPRWDELVTGGALGDGLFFMASGYTLLIGRSMDFIPWYRRRISRIYPTVIAWALLSSLVWGWEWSVWDLVTTPRYWFLSCIMVYYILFWMIRRWATDRMRWVVLLTAAVILAANYLILDRDNSMMYAQVGFMRVYYFSFMLLGAMVAMKSQRDVTARRAFTYLMLSLIAYYACMAVYKFGPFYCQFQLISLLPLLSAIYWLFRWCDTPWTHRILQCRGLGWAIRVISELTLEVYLVQYVLFTDRFNQIFPLNLLLIYLLIFCLAYLLKVLSRIVALLFNEKPIDFAALWRIG